MTVLLWVREVVLSGAGARDSGHREPGTRGLEYVPAIALNLLLFSIVMMFE